MSTDAPGRDTSARSRQFLERLAGRPLTFGGLLKAIREGEELSLAKFAAPLRVSRQHLCDVEQGRRAVTPGRAAEWARILGYSEAQFVRLSLQDQLSQAGLDLRVSIDSE